MSEPIRCPDCGAENAADATACGRCNYPLVPSAASGVPPLPPADAAVPVVPPPAEPPVSQPDAVPPLGRPLPHRPIRSPRARAAGTALSIWLFVGGFAALLLVYMAIRANVERASEPVEGSSAAQQRRADELIAALGRDSTDLDARQQLADVYYDTGNWSEAVTHYRRVVAADSGRVTALVDLGVSHYNLGDPGEAERHFRLALRRDPHQPIALFNLGIVHERREDWEGALRYYHAALQSDPPENMSEPLMQAMQRIQEKTGRQPQPLTR